eukprot:comp20389_c1_seq1/m.25779 comp20389_c1_seq1/g.25779  ORF comp20389_c1_seq1/g.25779 comp20389_c1_seq1/m.25779 type:complete len:414 (-) comp20389_c1_seq1:36-1277(-)
MCDCSAFSTLSQWLQGKVAPLPEQDTKKSVAKPVFPNRLADATTQQPDTVRKPNNFPGGTLELERFLVVEKDIGKGSTSAVHAAIDLNTGAKVAMKRMPRNASNCLQILRERDTHKLASATGHPHIVKCIDVYEDGHKMTLILEYLQGGDLLDYIPPDEGLQVQEVLRFSEHLLCALVHLHDLGIAHRDIKPENCLLSSDKQTLKLCDFGHAVCDTSTILLSENCGTLPYMSPEMVARRVVDFRTADVWSAGCVIFAMATGRFPWCLAANTNSEYLLYAQGKHSAEEGKRWAKLDPQLREIIELMLVIDPKKRATAKEVLEMIRERIRNLNLGNAEVVMTSQEKSDGGTITFETPKEEKDQAEICEKEDEKWTVTENDIVGRIGVDSLETMGMKDGLKERRMGEAPSVASACI